MTFWNFGTGNNTMREVLLFIVEGVAFLLMLAVIAAWLYVAAGVYGGM